MRLLSTRDKGHTTTAARAFLQGLSPEGGLFVPESYPTISLTEIEALVAMSYPQRAAHILSLFLDEYSQEELLACTQEAYGATFDAPEVAPVRKLGDAHIMELWHGPTAAFKDVALQLLPHLMGRARHKVGVEDEIFILVATSGDTGKAALDGFADVPGTRIAVFYPDGGVSEAQRLQMVTQTGDNVHVIAVRGNFDQAQTGVKQLLTDPAFIAHQKAAGRVLSSANSINFGRLLPQVVYYFSAYADLIANGTIAAGDKVNFAVPTGNFGNILAGWYALSMGLPIHKLICASNRNHVLADFIATGSYDAKRDFHLTTSPSMDILISSNLERLLFDLCDRDDALLRRWMTALQKTGGYEIGEARTARMQRIFYGGWADEEATAAAIRAMWEGEGYLMDPHTAVAHAIYAKYRADTHDATPTVIMSTANPYKFPRAVLRALGVEGPCDEFACADLLRLKTGQAIPASLSALRDLLPLHDTLCEIAQMKDALLQLP